MRVLIVIITAVHSVFSMTTSASAEEGFRLYVLHTNDIHSRFEMFNRRDLVCKEENLQSEDPKKKCFGGVIRRAGFVNDFRQSHENVLLLDAGDQFQGSPWFYTYKGVEASHFLNLLKYDAMALGNHEFDNGVKGLEPFLSNLTVPVLCSNMIMDKNVPEFIKQSVKSHVVVEKGGRRIGIIGYLISSVPSLSKTGNISFEEEAISIKRISKELKNEGVDIIIAVGHSGLTRDKEMAAKLPDVDLFVGGHSQSLFYSGDNPNKDKADAEYPIVFTHEDGSKTLVVQAGSLGKYVGKLELTFDSSGKITQFAGNPVAIDNKIQEDKEIKVHFDAFYTNISHLYKMVVGCTQVTLDSSEDRCRINECNMGNMYADAMVESAREIQVWRNLTIALPSSGTFRASFPKGNITYADVISAAPYGDTLDVVILSGFVIKEMLEHSVTGFDLVDKKGKYLQLAGLRVTYNMKNQEGNRVEKLEIDRCYKCNNWNIITATRNYPVILSTYMINGGDGYTMIKESSKTIFNINLLDSEVIINYLKKHSPVNVQIEGRIKGMETTPGWKTVGKAETDSGSRVQLWLPLTACPIVLLLINFAFAFRLFFWQ